MGQISENLLNDMKAKGIDVPLTLEILEAFNAGFYDNAKPIRAKGVPPIDGSTVIDLRRSGRTDRDPLFAFDRDKARANLARFGIKPPPGVEQPFGKGLPTTSLRIAEEGAGAALATFSAADLLAIGEALLPFAAYGVLNGGSATSYADSKKNLALGSDVFESVESSFKDLAPLCKDLPKGITPAFVNPDGSPGPSFLELKMRARLLLAKRALYGGKPAGGEEPTAERSSALSDSKARASSAFLPLFQMTSVSNDAGLSAFYAKTASSPFLRPLAERLGLDPAEWRTGVQPMIAAYSHSSEGRPKRVFDSAYGKSDSSLPLPGGHGQCFRVLADVFRALRSEGIRYACLGNVDNLGYTVDPVELAVMVISGAPAGFDFAVRTPMDVKGGILVETEDGKYTVADIGPAIRFEEVVDLERRGFTILFNCASGIFDLDYLAPRIDDIAKRLPVRFSDQDKDAGKYSQAEQVTWEVTKILPGFLAFAVEKRERFLAAKLLVDTLLTSGVGLGAPSMPADVKETAEAMHEGLESLLRGTYGLELSCGKWIPGKLVGG